MNSLYELTGLFQSLLEQEELDTTEVESLITDYLHKLEGYCIVLTELRAQAEKFKAEEKRLNDRRKVIENNLQRLNDAMISSMETLSLDKVEAGTFKITLRQNPPSLVQQEGATPPERFVEMIPKVDNAGIKAAIKSGETIEGFELASLGKGLIIK